MIKRNKAIKISKIKYIIFKRELTISNQLRLKIQLIKIDLNQLNLVIV